MFKITTVLSVALFVGCGDVHAPIDKVEVNMPAPAPVVTPAPEAADDGIESAVEVVEEAELIVDEAELEPIAEEVIEVVIEESKPEWPKVMRVEMIHDPADSIWYFVDDYKCDFLVNRDPVTMYITIGHKGTCAGLEVDFEATYIVLGWTIKNVKSIWFGEERVSQGGDTLNSNSKYDPRITITMSRDMRPLGGKIESYGYSLILPVD